MVESRAAAVVLPITSDSASTETGAGFVGRDNELDQLLALLGRTSSPSGLLGAVVVSAVAGMAGVGKTALAWQAARAAIRRGWFAAGAWFVDLHGYDPDPTMRVRPERVYASLLGGLGVPPDRIPVTVDEQASKYQQVLGELAAQGKAVLLVADNVGDAEQVAPLLPAAGRVHRVLVTSRDSLAALPATANLDLQVLCRDEAVELLTTAVAARRPGDQRLTDNVDGCLELARLCAGLPLALQIIAALLAEDPGLPVTALTDELAAENSRLEALAYDRRWAVRATFDLSYQRLPDEDARLFRLLGVAPGADMSTGSAAALADTTPSNVRRGLIRLARAHLIDQHQPSRWRMHDLLRLYATGKVAETPGSQEEVEAALARMLGHYSETLAAARVWFDSTAREQEGQFTDIRSAQAWLAAERANLIAAIADTASNPSRQAQSVRMALDLALFLLRGRYIQDFLTVASIANDIASKLDHVGTSAGTLHMLATALRESGRFDEAITAHEQVIVRFRECGDRPGAGRALTALGNTLSDVQRFDEAIVAHQQAIAIFSELGDTYSEARVRNNLGSAFENAGRFDDAISAYEQALPVFRRFRNRHGEATVLFNSGRTLAKAGRLNEGIDPLQSAIVAFRDASDRHGEGVALTSLGQLFRNAHRFDEAITVLEQAAAIYPELRELSDEGGVLMLLGLALGSAHRFDEAVTVFEHAAAIYRQLGERNEERTALKNIGLALSLSGTALSDVRLFKEAQVALERAAEAFDGAEATGDSAHMRGQAALLAEIAELVEETQQ